MKFRNRLVYYLASKMGLHVSFMRVPLSERTKRIPGMLTYEERRFLQNYCRYVYSGTGHIVDLGCWMGSSTLPLAIERSRRPDLIVNQQRIFAYDLFRWEKWMDACITNVSQAKYHYSPGESFRSAFEGNIKDVDNVVIREQDLATAQWRDGDIEFLFVDAMKTPQLALAIQKQFFPMILGGKGVVVHQDFVHYYTYWIHILTYRLRDFLILLYDVKDSASTAFRCRKRIPPDVVQKETFELESICEDEVEEAFSYSLHLINSSLSHRVLSAKALLYFDQGRIEKAESVFREEMSAEEKKDGEVMAAMSLVATRRNPPTNVESALSDNIPPG